MKLNSVIKILMKCKSSGIKVQNYWWNKIMMYQSKQVHVGHRELGWEEKPASHPAT